jgi:uncharacterized cupin superfamily protein
MAYAQHMAARRADEPFVTHASLDEGWEHDDETSGWVRMVHEDARTQIGLWKPGALAGSAIEFEPPVHETFVVLGGSGELRVDDGELIELRPGAIVSLPRGCRTRWVVDEDFRELWVYSSPS